VFFQTSRDVREQQISFARRAMELDADSIEESLLQYIHSVHRMGDHESLRSRLERSNDRYAAMDGSQRAEHIEALNTQWMNAASDAPVVTERMNNRVAEYLRREQANSRVRVGEIFLTNRYGVTLATTGRLTTLAHAHKYWWQAAYNEGLGRPFIDDRGYDTSVGAWVIGVVVPIVSDHGVAGILKVNYIIESLLANALRFARLIGTEWDLTVVRSDGTVLASSKGLSELPAELIGSLTETGATYTKITTGGPETLFVWAPVPGTVSSFASPFGFGGSAESIDHLSGNAGQHWTLVSHVPATTIHAIVRRRLLPAIVLGVLLLGVILLSSFVLGRQLTKRLTRLQNAVLGIDPMDPQWAPFPVRNDEVDVLASELQDLVERLRHTIHEKDELLREQRELNDSLVKKDTLIKEVNHRVKNNLFMVRSLLSLKEAAEGYDLTDVRNQINSIQLVHEFLYRGDSLDTINFHDYARAILESVFAGAGDIEFHVDEQTRRWDLPARTAVTMGLILNEVATNAAKHGFRPDGTGRFFVSAANGTGSDHVILRMSNDGKSLPQELELKHPTTLGLQLIRALTNQLDGTLTIEREPMTTFVVTMPTAGIEGTEDR
jgi:two-component sensor histidine kinase